MNTVKSGNEAKTPYSYLLIMLLALGVIGYAIFLSVWHVADIEKIESPTSGKEEPGR